MPASRGNPLAMGEYGPTPEQLARHLQKLREAAGLTPEQVAERSGLSLERVVLIESGAIDQGLEEVTRYASALGMPLSVVFRLWERSLN